MHLMSLSKIILNSSLSFLFPDCCVICFKPAGKNRFVCSRCKKDLEFLPKNGLCRTCLEPFPGGYDVCGGCLSKKPHYSRLISCLYYSGKIRLGIHKCKFRNRPDLCRSFGLMASHRLSDIGVTDFDAVVPIPMTKDSLKERGFNQAELIAKVIAESFNVPCISNALIKCRKTRRQSELRMKEREQNVRGAFALEKPNTIRGKKLLIVDDIFTTGSTMREASKVLSREAQEIYALTIAKTNFKSRLGF